ncbi:MAG: hypothetical protein IJ542_02515 [Clostridia bacterium]|nr:hypothetical protein [Clostridia bacterium]
MSTFSSNLMDLIRKYCNGKSYIKIAKEIGISKQLLNNYLKGKNKTVSDKKSQLILNWANKYDSTLNADWLFGESKQIHNAPLNGVDLSQKSIETIKLLYNIELSPLLNFLFECKEFSDLLIEIKEQQDIIKQQAKHNEQLDLEFAEFKIQKSIYNLVNRVNNEFSKLYSTYYVKELVPSEKQNKMKKDSNE